MEKKNLEKYYRLVTQGLPVALFLVDADYKITEFNTQAEALTGWSQSEVIGKSCHKIFCSSLCQLKCPLQESIDKKSVIVARRAVITTKDGRSLPIIFSSSAHCDEQGNFLTGVEVFRDASNIVRLEEQRKSIISLFTHDLKSPVAIAGGLLDRLGKGKAGELNAKQQQYVESAQKEIQRLEEYILSFLEISRIETGNIVELKPELFDAALLLEETAKSFSVQASQKNITIQCDTPQSLPMLEADKLHLGRVLTNLFDNAIKYSNEEDTIEASVEKKEDSLLFFIRDHGPGIPAQNIDHVFEHFYRIPEHRGKTAGTGLGLASVRAIIEAHGGEVWLKSRLGEGCTFYFTLPLSFSPALAENDELC